MTDDLPQWTIVIPTLEERENIVVLLRAIEAQALAGWPACEVVVVDDRSEDGTAALVAGTAFSIPVRVIERERVGGLAAAVLRGVVEARAATVVVMDADLSHPPEMIAALARPVVAGTHDLAIGSRHVPGGGCPGWPWRRRLLSRGAALLATPFTHVGDPMSGFFAARRETLLGLGAEPKGYKILLEALARHADPARVLELPIIFRDRRLGLSKLGLRTVRDYLLRLVVLGGCNLSPRAGAGFALVGAIGVGVDLGVFSACRASGCGLAAAHIAGFTTATISNFLLNARFAFAAQPGWGAYLRFLTVALLALVLRGGVLASALAAGLPELVAAGCGIAAGAVVNLLGTGFWVFPRHGSVPAGRWRLAAMGVVAYLVLLRLAYAGRIDLSVAESASAVASLFDGNAFAVRLPALACWGAALVALCRLAGSLWGRDAAWGAALAFAAMPFAIGTGLLMTPGAPLLAAWSWLLLAVWESWRTRHWAWWLVAALAAGAGSLCWNGHASPEPGPWILLVLAGPLPLAAMVAGWGRGRCFAERGPSWFLAGASAVAVVVLLTHPGSRADAGGPLLSVLVPVCGAVIAGVMHAPAAPLRTAVFAVGILVPVLATGCVLHYLAIGLPGVR